MAIEASQPLKIGNLVAAADYSAVANRYKFVKLGSTTGTFEVCSAVTDMPIGVLQNLPKSGEPGEITAIGVTKVQADENLAYAAIIATSADGQAQAFVAGTDTTAYGVGRCISDPGAAGGIATAVVNCVVPFRGITGI